MPTPPPSPLPPSLPESLPPSIPSLSTYAATTSGQKVAALRLIANSVAQQRQAASRALISHPLPVAFAVLLLGLLAKYMAWPLLLTTSAGVVMALLVAVRGATGGYLVAAEQMGWAFMQGTEKGDDADDGGRGKGKIIDETVVLVTVWGEEVIGTVVMKVLKKERKALIRAWTVGLKYREKGVGKALLEEAVRLAITERGCKGVEFDKGHASEWLISLNVFNYFHVSPVLSIILHTFSAAIHGQHRFLFVSQVQHMLLPKTPRFLFFPSHPLPSPPFPPLSSSFLPCSPSPSTPPPHPNPIQSTH